MSAPPISGTASGYSLPTPVKYDTGGRGEGDNYHGLGWQAKYVGDVTGPAGQYPKGFKPSQARALMAEDGAAFVEHAPGVAVSPPARRKTKWSTPVAHEERASKYTIETSLRHSQEGRQTHLAQEARDPRLHPQKMETPNSSNGLRGGSGSEHRPGMYQSPGHPEYGELSPEWVEWIMGWPIGWTSLTPMDPAAFDAWEREQSGAPGQARWWLEDPSDAEGSGITKTVPKGDKEDEKARQGRIAALGNGQVSAACAGAFLHIWNQDDPEGA